MADDGAVEGPVLNEHTRLLYNINTNGQHDHPVPQTAWYLGLLSTLYLYCSNMCRLFRGPWFAVTGGKLEALARCLCLPCIVITQAVNEQRSNFKQSGIVYLYLFLSAIVVINLTVVVTPVSDAKNIQLYFVLVCIVLAMVNMIYLCVSTRETLVFRDWSFRAGYPPQALMWFFYQGGLYIFGFPSFVYSLGIAYDNINCSEPVAAAVNILKTLYIIVQTLFLNKFYKVRIPDDTRGIRVVLAHLLGTNFALSFWILCSGAVRKKPEVCSTFPITIPEIYFSPLLVEYLLIAACLFYHIWQDLLPTHSVSRQRVCQINAEILDENRRRDEDRGIRAGIFRNSLGLGIVVGWCFAAVILLLAIASSVSRENFQIYHIVHSSVIITLYVTQILVCYIILLSARSLDRDAQRTSLDYEDALLHLSLIGSLLWKGFHLYILVVIENIESKSFSKVRHLDIAANSLGMLQAVFQTTTFINLRRYQPARDRRSAWISQCFLFLMTTNLSLWMEISFTTGIATTTPGEEFTVIQYNFTPIAYIVHPLNIFFRFHSAVYCSIAWSIFRT